MCEGIFMSKLVLEKFWFSPCVLEVLVLRAQREHARATRGASCVGILRTRFGIHHTSARSYTRYVHSAHTSAHTFLKLPSRHHIHRKRRRRLQTCRMQQSLDLLRCVYLCLLLLGRLRLRREPDMLEGEYRKRGRRRWDWAREGRVRPLLPEVYGQQWPAPQQFSAQQGAAGEILLQQPPPVYSGGDEVSDDGGRR